MDRKEYIIYTRVSTKEQGESGLGLEAQLETCRSYVKSQNGIIVSEYSDVESGSSRTRQGLNDAIEDAQMHDATIVFAKLDRLARDAEYAQMINNSGVKLYFCDFPHINKMVFGIMVNVFEGERDFGVKRTQDALDVIKENIRKDGYHVTREGKVITRLGNTRDADEDGGYRQAGIKGGERAAEVHRAKKEASRDWRMSYKEACKLRDEGLPYRTIAERLNEGEYKNSKGGSWSWQGVYKMLN